MKKYLFGFAAVLLAIGFTAFKSQPVAEKNLVAKYWVVDISSFDVTDGDVRKDQSKYILANGDGTSVSCPAGVARLCQIFVEPDANNPNQPAIPVSADANSLYQKLYNSDLTAPAPLTSVIFRKPS